MTLHYVCKHPYTLNCFVIVIIIFPSFWLNSKRNNRFKMDFQEMSVIEEHTTTEGPHRKESGKRGRKPGRKSGEKVDMKAKLERSRQSARECRARKKLRYQYLEELVADREKAVFALRKELERYQMIAKEIDEGKVPENIQAILDEMGTVKREK